ncbi:T9SS type A sorting domain-containing protein [Lewinella sp. 4G2]|uniref:T9SS type A sorting domain-containing protein n=1 Tax=Lewinella sp. 4G2 TaxID=1803372 RepID=UPI0007B4EAA3|nr:T9SS type A sorting domain-containing protein [Lewinella sp. 4G2]OAV45368.1 hypothetical protein A3850_013085 [Lewinella sp. 4G2]
MLRLDTTRKLLAVCGTTLLLLLSTFTLVAQHCPNKTALGSTVSVWDWQQARYDFQLIGGARNTASPFTIVNNNIPPNVGYISLSNGVPDYLPENGWELLYRNFGTVANPVNTASFGLYNRYTGMVRALFFVENRNQTFNLSSIDVNYTTGQGQFDDGAHVLRYASDIIEPLNEFIPTTTDGFEQFNILQTGGVWCVLDFPAAYDPCVCESLSLVSFQPTLQAITEINLIIEGTGTSQAVYSSSGGPNSTEIDVAARISEGIFGGLKRYKDYGSVTEKINLLSDFKWLPVVGGVLKTLDFFVNGKKTSPTLLGFESEYSFDATGTNTFTLPDSEVGILTPGAESPASNSGLGSLVPTYNNPLGVFGLLETPVVEFKTQFTESGNYQNCTYANELLTRYRFDASSIVYTINSAAGLEDRPLSIQAALRFGCEQMYPDWVTQGRDEVLSPQFGLFPGGDTPNELFTPLLNLECLEDYTVEIARTQTDIYNSHYQECESDESGLECDDVRLILLVALERTDGEEGQEIVLSLSYNVDLREADGSFASIPDNPYLGADVADINANCTDIPAPAPASYITSFCNDDYDATLGSRGRAYQSPTYDMSYLDNYVPPTTVVGPGTGTGPVGPSVPDNGYGPASIGRGLTVSPNPASTSITITPPDVATTYGTLFVYSLDGTLITSTRVQLDGPVTLDVNSLHSGTYLLRLVDGQSNELGQSRVVVE